MPLEDDASYKLLFSAPEVVRDLVLGFIPDDWLHSLDYSTLEKVPGSYVTDNLRHRADDVIWRVRAEGEWIYLYLLIDENQYSEAALAGLKNLVAAIIRFEHPENERALLGLIDLLNDMLDGKPELKRTFAIWIRALLLRQSRHTLALPKVRDLKELKMTLAERFDQWAQKYEQKGFEQGIERGIERGIEKGEALVLQKLLTKRFGTLPRELVIAISAASAAQIDVWVDRVLDAASLEEVFRP